MKTSTTCPLDLSDLGVSFTSVRGQSLLDEVKSIGYDLSFPTNRTRLRGFVAEYDLEGLEVALTRVGNRKNVRTSRAALLAGILRDGLFPNEEEKLNYEDEDE